MDEHQSEENLSEEDKERDVPAKWRRKSLKQIFSRPNIIRVVNMIVCGIAFAALWIAFFLTLAGVIEDPYNRMFSYAACSLLMLAPFIIEMIFGIKLSDFILTFFVLYALLAGVLGAGFALYRIVPYFDKAVHTLFGYVGCIVGLLIVCKLSDYKRLNPLFVVIVCFAVSLACGACWEIMEFTADMFFGQTAQGLPVTTVDGKTVVDRLDTMLDIICNFCGAILFIIHYIVHVLTRRNLVMGSIIRDLNRKD